MLLTRSPLVYPRKGLTVRLACVKHAASVRPEPGSNSPLKNIGNRTTPQKKQPRKPSQTTSNQTLTKIHHWINQISLKETQHATPKKRPRDGKKHNKTTKGPAMQKIGIDLKHTVEFSRFGHSQTPTTNRDRHTGATRPTLPTHDQSVKSNRQAPEPGWDEETSVTRRLPVEHRRSGPTNITHTAYACQTDRTATDRC